MPARRTVNSKGSLQNTSEKSTLQSNLPTEESSKNVSNASSTATSMASVDFSAMGYPPHSDSSSTRPSTGGSGSRPRSGSGGRLSRCASGAGATAVGPLRACPADGPNPEIPGKREAAEALLAKLQEEYRQETIRAEERYQRRCSELRAELSRRNSGSETPPPSLETTSDKDPRQSGVARAPADASWRKPPRSPLARIQPSASGTPSARLHSDQLSASPRLDQPFAGSAGP